MPNVCAKIAFVSQTLNLYSGIPYPIFRQRKLSWSQDENKRTFNQIIVEIHAEFRSSEFRRLNKLEVKAIICNQDCVSEHCTREIQSRGDEVNFQLRSIKLSLRVKFRQYNWKRKLYERSQKERQICQFGHYLWKSSIAFIHSFVHLFIRGLRLGWTAN